MAKDPVRSEGDFLPADGMAPARAGNGAEKGASPGRGKREKDLLLIINPMIGKTSRKRIKSVFSRQKALQKKDKNGIL